MMPEVPWLTVVPPAMNALTTTVKMLTPMPPAMPTKPPAMPAVRPKSSSDEFACTARPWKALLTPKAPAARRGPVGDACRRGPARPGRRRRCRRRGGRRSSSSRRRPRRRRRGPPRHPAPSDAATRTRSVASSARTSMLFPARRVTPVPVVAVVVRSSTVTPTAPARPASTPMAADGGHRDERLAGVGLDDDVAPGVDDCAVADARGGRDVDDAHSDAGARGHRAGSGRGGCDAELVEAVAREDEDGLGGVGAGVVRRAVGLGGAVDPGRRADARGGRHGDDGDGARHVDGDGAARPRR